MFRVCSLVFRVCRIVEQNQRPSTVEIIIEIRLDGVKGEIRGVEGAAPGSALRSGMQVRRGRPRGTHPRGWNRRETGVWRAFGTAGSKAPGARRQELGRSGLGLAQVQLAIVATVQVD